MSGGSGPHDAVFRRVLGEPANAASQLRAVLPAGLVGRLDLDRLVRAPGSFVDPKLRWRHAERVGEAPTEQLHDLFTQLGPEAEEAYMTTAEMLRLEGEARGEARGHAKALVQLLTLKFGPLPQAALDLVHTASIDQLETWTGRVLTADTLDDVLR